MRIENLSTGEAQKKFVLISLTIKKLQHCKYAGG